MKRIALIGGGTGGHIYPLIAVRECLVGYECRYFGPNGPWTKVLREAGIPTTSIAGAKLRRYFSLWNLIDGPVFIWSVFQALVKVAVFAPDAAFSKGGPGSLPVLFACYLYGVPIMIHESDSVPSTAGRIAGKWAKVIGLGWNNAVSYFPGKKTHVVGVPLRKEIRAGIHMDQAEAKRTLGLDKDMPVVLVIGGSQGSDRINNLILGQLSEILVRYQVVHQIGSGTYAEYMKRYGAMKREVPEPLHANYWPYEYLDTEMATTYAAADAVISRAGSAIFEIAAYGKPTILIPLPEAANNHQTVNADNYPAAIVIPESAPEKDLIRVISSILDNPERRKEMEEKARAFAKPDAAEKIAGDIMEIIKK